MGFLEAYKAYRERTDTERKQEKEDQQEKAKNDVADLINSKIKALIAGEISAEDVAAEKAKPEIEAAKNAASTDEINKQYEQGKTLTQDQGNAIVEAANVKTPFPENLFGLSAQENLLTVGKSGGNLSQLPDVTKYGYAAPEKPMKTTESKGAEKATQETKGKEIRKTVKPDYSRLAINIANELSAPMLKAGITAKDVPLFETLGKGADLQAKENISSKKDMDTMAEAQKWKDQFLNDPVARNVVKLYAFGRMSESEAMAKVPGFNKQSGPARLALTYAAVELNPPQFDENANLIGGFDPRKFAVGRAEEMAEASKQGQLKDEIIEKEAKKTYATTLASQNAQLDPGIVERKIDKQARGVTAGTLLKQRMAAQRAISTFKDSLNQFGKYENIPQWMYRDLASDYAKILQATGQIAEGSVDKVMQLSLSGNVVGLWNFLTGDTKTTAPHKVLKLMYDRINALRVDLDKQYYNQTKGENIPINSDESTNPLKPKEQGTSAKPKEGGTSKSTLKIGDIEDGYRYKGGNPKDKKSWEKVK